MKSEFSNGDVNEIGVQSVENYRNIRPEKVMTRKELKEAVNTEWVKAAGHREVEHETDEVHRGQVEDGEKQQEKGDGKLDNEGMNVEKIPCRNEDLAGKEHPITGVPFVRRIVEVGEKLYEVVVPKFKSEFTAQLSEDKWQATDREQFSECNKQLKDGLAKDPELRNKFTDDQLEQIENGDTPDGYTWHHDADVGKMQLVDTETHQKTGHTGGRSIWGGGTDNR